MDPNETKQQSQPWTLWAVVFVIILSLGAVAAWALTGKSTEPEATADTSSVNQSTQLTDSETGAATDTPETAETAIIVFGAAGFSPEAITVKKGTVVTIKNESDNSVQFSSDNHPSHLTNPEMNASTIGPGESTTYTANTVGTFGFHDHIDDSKTGTVTVTE